MRRLILLSSDNCGFCNAMKSALKEQIDSGKIEVIDITKDMEAKRIARLYGGVPTLLEENDGELIELELKEE